MEVEKFNKLKDSWWDFDGNLGVLHKFNKLRVPYVKSFIADFNSYILDFGCGGGIFSEGLYNEGFNNITGIDLAEDSIKVATEHANNYSKNIIYKNIDIADVKEKYDAVLCSEVLEHVDNLEMVLSSIYNATKDGGLMFFSTINKTVRAFFETIIVPEYILRLVDKKTHHFDKLIKPSDILKVLNSCQIIDFRGVSYSIIDKHFYFRENIDSNYFIMLKKI